MNNEHNPIAQRINHLQDVWTQQRMIEPNAQFVRWMINEPDLPLVNGFYKLESSPYGKIEETIVVMLTDFESPANFSYTLAKDWLEAYKKDTEKYPELKWPDFDTLNDHFKQLDKEDTQVVDDFLVELLTKFKTYEGKTTPMFVGINPRKVGSHDALCAWLTNIIELLPKNIGFVVTDYKEGNYFDAIFKDEEAIFIKQTIRLKNQDIKGAYTDLMIQGDPNDPQVAFRKCMIKMGEGASNNNLNEVVKWGKRGLEITQSTGNLSFWASAHLIYAGFLFGFKDDKRIFQLLDNGIEIGHQQIDDKSLLGVTLQLYAYKAAYYSIIDNKLEAITWFLKQARLAIEYNEQLIAVSAYKSTMLLLDQIKDIEELENIAPEAYKACVTIESEILKTTEFAYLGKHHIDILRNNKEEQTEKEIQEVDIYMRELFGSGWENQGKELWKKLGKEEVII